MRWLIGLAVVAVLGVAGDAALRSYVEGRIESRLASELGSETPQVSLGGFPFVVRLVSGRIPTVTLEADNARRAGLEIATVSLDLEGVRMSLDTTQTSGSASARVERGTGRAQIDLEVLADYIERRTPLDVIRFTGQRVTVALRGRRATVPLRLEDGAIVIRVPSRDDINVPLPRVLQGIEYRTLEVRSDSVLLSFELHNATLRSIWDPP